MNKRYYSKKNAEFPCDKNQKVKMQARKKAVMVIAIFSAVLIFLVYTVLDTNLNPPGWWRFDRLGDKKAILGYVEENYPETIKRTGSKFPFQYPAGPFEHSVMYFELDGVNFGVSAWAGKITNDTYYEAKAEKYIRENFIDGFMNERGLSPEIEITFVIPPDYYGLLQKYILDDIHSFTGSITVMIKQDNIDGVYTPKEVGWFYDFYQYWTEKCDLPRCTVYLYYRQNDDKASYRIWFNRYKRIYSNEKDFYDHFTTE